MSAIDNTYGMLNYARCCENGIGGSVDMKEYVKYIEKAACSNNKDAQYRYGLILEKGELIEQNLHEAAKFFRNSANQFNQMAMFKYINCLSNGIGVKKNIYQAMKFCQKLIYYRKKSKISNDNPITDKIYKDLLSHLNDDDYIVDDIEINELKEYFIIDNKIIKYKGKEYKYDFEQLICGKEDIKEILKKLNEHKNNIYPQGFRNCQNLLNQQMNNNGTILYCPKRGRPWTIFYFPLIFDEGYHVYFESDFNVEIDKIKIRENDIYPQGREYCLKLLEENKIKGGCVRILSRKISKINRILFYFKSFYNGKYPTDKNSWEEVFFIEGTKNIDKHIIEMEEKRKNRQNHFYSVNPKLEENYEECIKIVQKAQNNKDFFIILRNGVYSELMNCYRYFPSKAIFTTLCEEEFIIKGEKRLRIEIEKIKDDNYNSEKLPNHVIGYPQGKENCINLIEEQIENGGKIHIFKRKCNYSSCFWFYFKA